MCMNESKNMKRTWRWGSLAMTLRSCIVWIRKHSLWIFGSLILIALAILFSWIVIHYHLLEDDSQQCPKPMCLTSDCIKIASTILDRIDQSMNPCEDFYQYSCGNFLKSNLVPKDSMARNLLQEMQDGMFVDLKNYLEAPIETNDAHEITQIKKLYTSCINETDDDQMLNSSVESLLALIVNLTGNEWPVLTTRDTAMLSEIPLETKLALLYLHQVQPFFQIFVAPNRNISTYALHIYPASPVLEQLNIGVNKHNFENITNEQIEFYLNFQKEIIKTLLTFKGEPDTPDRKDQIMKDIEEMFVFEYKLVNITKDVLIDHTQCEEAEGENCDERLLNPNLFVNISIEQMEKEFPKLQWGRFFRQALREVNVTLKHTLIHSKEYFSALQTILESHSTRTLHNYLGWSVIAKYIPYLGQQFKHLSADFPQKISVTDSDVSESTNGFKFYESRWKQCIHIVCDSLKIPSITLYLKYQNKDLKKMNKKIHKLINDMKRVFSEIIQQQVWIESDEAADILSNRVMSIRSNVGVPDYVLNRSLIERMYIQLDVDPDKELISNMFKINRHETLVELRKLNQPLRPNSEWLFQPLDANAFYDFTRNDIIMPVGIIRKPLVFADIPRYLELAFLGIVVGHEIAHSIDMNSRKHFAKYEVFSKSGFSKLYKNKAQCFADKYSSYQIDEISKNVNGDTTLEENICDFASIQQAYALFQSLEEEEKVSLPGLTEFTADQIFFLHYAQLWCEVTSKDGHLKSLQDNHSPGRFRANGVLMNTEWFAEAFHCRPGDAMHPANKCDLWRSPDRWPDYED